MQLWSWLDGRMIEGMSEETGHWKVMIQEEGGRRWMLLCGKDELWAGEVIQDAECGDSVEQ
jgi:hypothetical protein